MPKLWGVKIRCINYTIIANNLYPKDSNHIKMKDNNCTKICSFENFLIRTSKIRLSPDEITDDILAKANLTRSKYYKRSVKSSQVCHFWSDGWQCFSPQAGLDLDGDTQRVRSSCSFWLLSKKKYICYQVWGDCALRNAQRLSRRLSKWGHL